MDIERVNDYTLKLYISYDDIEERGYSREEIWYNRGKGEQLFWDMIEEIGEEADFELEGAIWIHVNAAETGIEVVVTRTSDKEELPPMQEQDQSFEKFVEETFGNSGSAMTPFKESPEEVVVKQQYAVFRLQQFDDIISIAKRLQSVPMTTTLYKFEGTYYFSVEALQQEQNILDVVSIVNEYAELSQMTKHRLREYADIVMDGNCVETVLQYFAS
ncbi:MAG: adaptor protein MecA [Caryophanon sp.]|nr:adaptor protein MecA [Caryophanon sp.]